MMPELVQKLKGLNGKDGKILDIDKFPKFMIQLSEPIKKSPIMNIKLNNINMATLIGMMVQRAHMVILNIWMSHIILIIIITPFYKLLLLMM
jgi:hypothetical protein